MLRNPYFWILRVSKKRVEPIGMITDLRVSEEMYRDLFDNASDTIWVHDLKGTILAVNKAAERFSGHKKDELLGKNITDFFGEDAYAMARTVKKKLVDGTSRVQRYEQRFQKKDGTQAIVELSTRLIRRNGRPVAFQNIARDVTEQRRAEQKIRQSERELSQIINGSSVPTFVLNKDHVLTHWNKACERLTGLSATEVVGTKKYWTPFYNLERPVMADLIVDGLSESEIDRHYSGKYRRSTLISGAYEAEDFFPNLGGHGRWLFFTAAPLRDEDDNVIGAIETLQDVTERRQADDALRQSERRYRDLFESASEAIIIRDLQGNIVEINQAASDLTGYTIGELADMNIRQFLTPESFKKAMEMQQRQIEGETANQRFELEIIRKEGEKRLIEVAIRLITGSGNGKPLGIQAIIRDITEERRLRDSMHFYLRKVLVAQEEERKRIARELHDDTAQSLLLITRELDNMMSDSQNQLAGAMQERLLRLHDLAVDTLKGLRRYTQELRPAILDDLGLIAALEWMADKMSEEDHIESEVQLDVQRKDLPQEVQLVLFRIAQEALVNIKRHSQASKVVIKLDSKQDEVKMIVVDNGKGLEPMNVGELSSSGKLGLIGMQERAQLLGGNFKIESEPGKGTAIIVQIPLED